MTENKKNSYTLDEILDEYKKNDPNGYESFTQHYNIKSKLIDEYKKTSNIPEFENIDEYYIWLKTPEGGKHIKTIERINKESNKQFKNQHGGARAGAGRKKVYNIERKKVTKILSIEAIKLLKAAAKKENLTESSLLEKLIMQNFKQA
jgi:hypothetical protein